MPGKTLLRVGPVARTDAQLCEIRRLLGFDDTWQLRQVVATATSAAQLVALASGADAVVTDPIPRPVVDAAIPALAAAGVRVFRMSRPELREQRNGRLYRLAGPPEYEQVA